MLPIIFELYVFKVKNAVILLKLQVLLLLLLLLYLLLLVILVFGDLTVFLFSVQ